MLAETIEFGATTDAALVLDAVKALPALLEVGPTKRIPAGFLDARKIAIEVVTPGWRELLLRRGRPPETVDRVAYVLACDEDRNTILSHDWKSVTTGGLFCATARHLK
ncbi:MAG: hypothetical protein WCF33_11585 [Pseudonocardiaceae bacterium]